MHKEGYHSNVMKYPGTFKKYNVRNVLIVISSFLPPNQLGFVHFEGMTFNRIRHRSLLLVVISMIGTCLISTTAYTVHVIAVSKIIS